MPETHEATSSHWTMRARTVLAPQLLNLPVFIPSRALGKLNSFFYIQTNHQTVYQLATPSLSYGASQAFRYASILEVKMGRKDGEVANASPQKLQLSPIIPSLGRKQGVKDSFRSLTLSTSNLPLRKRKVG